MKAVSILLVRHCEASGQAPEAPLTAVGAEAAVALSDRLRALGVDSLYSSPFRRALETVSPYAEKHALTVAIDYRLAERRLAASPVDDSLELVRLSFDDLHQRAPGGESLA